MTMVTRLPNTKKTESGGAPAEPKKARVAFRCVSVTGSNLDWEDYFIYAYGAMSFPADEGTEEFADIPIDETIFYCLVNHMDQECVCRIMQDANESSCIEENLMPLNGASYGFMGTAEYIEAFEISTTDDNGWGYPQITINMVSRTMPA